MKKDTKMLKLNMRDTKGNIKIELDQSKVLEVMGKYGDIINCISQNKFVKVDDVVELVWANENKNPRLKKFQRTRRQVEEAIQELLDNNFVEMK